MLNKYYSVDEIAELLKIHPKTIQRYIREGRLKANKVGKSWRVSGHDLSSFTEGGSESFSDPALPDKPDERSGIRISAVIDIPVFNTDAAVRIANTLTALSNSKPSEYGASSVQTQFLMPERVMRVMVWGSLSFTQVILDSIDTLINREDKGVL